jgi:hypothetical protein
MVTTVLWKWLIRHSLLMSHEWLLPLYAWQLAVSEAPTMLHIQYVPNINPGSGMRSASLFTYSPLASQQYTPLYEQPRPQQQHLSTPLGLSAPGALLLDPIAQR